MDETSPLDLDTSRPSDDLWNPENRYQLIWLDGVRISPFDCPSCLQKHPGPCVECSFFTPRNCRLKRDPFLREECASLFAHYRLHGILHQLRETAAVLAIYQELKAHGRPLHFATLAHMVIDRHPAIHLSETMVLRLLHRYQDRFETLGEGVFQSR